MCSNSTSNAVDSISGYSVHVLYDGYSSIDSSSKIMKANCSCTLIKGPFNIIVDTMTAWDKNKILEALSKHDVKPENINYVISTHGHSDHIGNNNLFLKATHVVGLSVSTEDSYDLNAFENGSSYKIDDNVEIVPTPGHTLSDVSVIVNSANLGMCAVTGDLFERFDDIEESNVWLEAGSESPEQQRHFRSKIANMVDWIIPGHGAPFKTTQNIRSTLDKQVKM